MDKVLRPLTRHDIRDLTVLEVSGCPRFLDTQGVRKHSANKQRLTSFLILWFSSLLFGVFIVPSIIIKKLKNSANTVVNDVDVDDKILFP